MNMTFLARMTKITRPTKLKNARRSMFTRGRNLIKSLLPKSTGEIGKYLYEKANNYNTTSSPKEESPATINKNIPSNSSEKSRLPENKSSISSNTTFQESLANKTSEALKYNFTNQKFFTELQRSGLISLTLEDKGYLQQKEIQTFLEKICDHIMVNVILENDNLQDMLTNGVESCLKAIDFSGLSPEQQIYMSKRYIPFVQHILTFIWGNKSFSKKYLENNNRIRYDYLDQEQHINTFVEKAILEKVIKDFSMTEDENKLTTYNVIIAINNNTPIKNESSLFNKESCFEATGQNYSDFIIVRAHPNANENTENMLSFEIFYGDVKTYSSSQKSRISIRPFFLQQENSVKKYFQDCRNKINEGVLNLKNENDYKILKEKESLTSSEKKIINQIRKTDKALQKLKDLQDAFTKGKIDKKQILNDFNKILFQVGLPYNVSIIQNAGTSIEKEKLPWIISENKNFDWTSIFPKDMRIKVNARKDLIYTILDKYPLKEKLKIQYVLDIDL